MTQRFPEDMGKDLGGKSFDEVFTTNPKIIEFVTIWTDNCTGLFTDFRKYVMARLDNPLDKEAHEDRCRQLVKSYEGTNIPRYLIKYR